MNVSDFFVEEDAPAAVPAQDVPRGEDAPAEEDVPAAEEGAPAAIELHSFTKEVLTNLRKELED
eukprot:gene23825-48471_t